MENQSPERIGFAKQRVRVHWQFSVPPLDHNIVPGPATLPARHRLHHHLRHPPLWKSTKENTCVGIFSSSTTDPYTSDAHTLHQANNTPTTYEHLCITCIPNTRVNNLNKRTAYSYLINGISQNQKLASHLCRCVIFMLIFLVVTHMQSHQRPDTQTTMHI